MNQTFLDQKSNKNHLIGYCNRSAFNDTTFCHWFDSEYITKNPDTGVLSAISKSAYENLKIVVVMATWCGDSRREVPRFMKIMDYLKIPDQNIQFINVDRKKEAEGTPVKDLKIEFVPTFIFYVNDVEIGRIIETPKETLEIDFVKILSEVK